ncbi:MAG: class I SAM-dependent methyltransferase [Sphingomonadales bacterium]|nr:class I SAM-dependent methyltransferase [Sphingomonadales bacterium]
MNPGVKLVRRWLGGRKLRGHLNAVSGRQVSGWAFGPRPAVVEVLFGDRVVAQAAPGIERGDVARAYPGQANARTSGFQLTLPQQAGLTEVTVRACERGGRVLELGRFTLASPEVVARVAAAPDSGIAGPFPRGVIDAVAVLWPEDCVGLETVEGQARFAARVAVLARTVGLQSLPAIADYCRYLTACWAHCRFVDRHFPTANAGGGRANADFHCKPNSVRELFSIIHQLYVLRSWGVDGAFGEFGCFKGFSTSMLSFAARQLGIAMHVFDSFEGLPPSDSTGYAAGDYAGSLDEVSDHVRRFGAPEVVTFHKGFFAETFRSYTPPPLMCLWMDVDLEVSARDLMVVADRLDPRATLFSHESEPGLFAADGSIVAVPHPDNPIPPMVARHEELGRPLAGRFLIGNTGAFWPRDGGIAAVDSGVLNGLVRALV